MLLKLKLTVEEALRVITDTIYPNTNPEGLQYNSFNTSHIDEVRIGCVSLFTHFGDAASFDDIVRQNKKVQCVSDRGTPGNENIVSRWVIGGVLFEMEEDEYYDHHKEVYIYILYMYYIPKLKISNPKGGEYSLDFLKLLYEHNKSLNLNINNFIVDLSKEQFYNLLENYECVI